MIRFFAVLGSVGLAIVGSGCGRSPTEPGSYLLPTPVATDRIMNLSHTVPATVYQGEVVTFSVTGSGLSDLGTWQQGAIQISVPGVFDLYHGTVLEADGTISGTPPQAESGGADLIISKRPFASGERLSVTARQRAWDNACLHSPSGCPAQFRVDILAVVESGATQKRQFVPAYFNLLAGPRPAVASGGGPLQVSGCSPHPWLDPSHSWINRVNWRVWL